jgi:hypothetical protein
MEPVVGIHKQVQLYARVKRFTDPKKVLLPVCIKEEEVDCCRFDTRIIQLVATLSPLRVNDTVGRRCRLLYQNVCQRLDRMNDIKHVTGVLHDTKMGDYVPIGSTFEEDIVHKNKTTLRQIQTFTGRITAADFDEVELFYDDDASDNNSDLVNDERVINRVAETLHTVLLHATN